MTASLTTRIHGYRIVFRLEPTGIGPSVWTAEFETGPLNYPTVNLMVGASLTELVSTLADEPVLEAPSESHFSKIQAHMERTKSHGYAKRGH